METPAKRRTLAPRDANAVVASPARRTGTPSKMPLGGGGGGGMNVMLTPQSALASRLCATPTRTGYLSPANSAIKPPMKRLIDAVVQEEENEMAKKARWAEEEDDDDEGDDDDSGGGDGYSDGETRSKNAPSPSCSSSVFDASSHVDTSRDTTATEADIFGADPVPAAAAPPPPRMMTRDQARQRAEILRLRLGLANYKLRTGQADVPLADLKRRPMPRPEPRPGPRPAARQQSEMIAMVAHEDSDEAISIPDTETSGGGVDEEDEGVDEEDEEEDEVAAAAARRESDRDDRAVRGLLRLARGGA